MGRMADHVSTTALTKEVLPPQKPSSGFGLMMVASLAMFFTVASSAFVLRARMVQRCPAAEANSVPQAVLMSLVPADTMEEPRTFAEERARECGKPEYRTNPDGSITVFYEVCPLEDQADEWVQIRSATPGVEVGNIR